MKTFDKFFILRDLIAIDFATIIDRNSPALILDEISLLFSVLLLRLSSYFYQAGLRDICGVQLTDTTVACIYNFELFSSNRLYIIAICDYSEFLISVGDLFINAC